jgi:hydroxysqualene dehydroxylase
VKRRLAVVGGGWAGLAAAVRATELGADVHLYEAARHWGGRARRLWVRPPGHTPLALDNGQHILIGAYRQTLALMRTVGLEPKTLLQAQPLDLRFADGSGLAVPPWARSWPAPLDWLAAVATARGWGWADKRSFWVAALRWRWQGFRCPPGWNVEALCKGLTPRVMQDLIEPLCVAALNTPASQASAQVLLTVLQDALLGPGCPPWKASTLLLPTVDLGRLMPDAATQWLLARGAQLHLGQRVGRLIPPDTEDGYWQVDSGACVQAADAVIVATAASDAARLLTNLPSAEAQRWRAQAQALPHEAIATVYLQGVLPHGWPARPPMMALRSGADGPAQYVFWRNALDGRHWPQDWQEARHHSALLAFVASACQPDKAALESGVCRQAAEQMGLRQAQVLQTVIEKRATFVCSPGLARAPQRVQAGLWAAGDHVQGPYPATLEGAVRSGLQAAEAACSGPYP